MLSLAFSARTLVLFRQLADDTVPDYLSGLLIGDGVRAGLATHSAVDGPTIIGRGV
nr:2-dehydro-3-deoxygalactonokinase [Pleomorphomonas koreensis]